MAAVLEQQKKTTAKFDSQVDEQIAQTTSRIRVHDLTFGILVLASMAAFYAAAMILLDKYLNIPEWARRFALVGFVGIMGFFTYRLIVLPLRRRINPLYAAARVEQTIDDAKNSVMGYVEAQEKGELHTAVKTAMSAKAAKAVGDADVNGAIDHKSVAVVGGIFIFLVLSLMVMFFIFRPAQFGSLVGRSFVPFSGDTIASRTQLTLVKPDPPETTITNGQTITVAVHVGGKVPSKQSPTRVRVMIRHNQADPDYEEIALKEGETSRDWQVRIPEDMVLNGFWYKVAAGDTETPEYRVTVRSLPLFKEFEATYTYPAYTRKPMDKSQSQSGDIRGPKGTLVTLRAQTNREVQEGTMKFEDGKHLTGKPVLQYPDTLEFKFKITEQTRYKLFMTTTSGERNTDSLSFAINVDADEAPKIKIIKPEQEEIEIPANGQLAVDASVGDDYGIDRVRLRLRVNGRDLKPVLYMGGQSFLRAKDNTWPHSLDYKDHADFAKLKYADETPFDPKPGMQIQYWVEAIDNCTETKKTPDKDLDWTDLPGNVGKSNIQRVSLIAPKTSPEDKQQLQQNKDERKNNENQHNQTQKQQFDNEKRDQQPQNGQPNNGDTNPNGQPNPDPNAPKPEQKDSKAGEKPGGKGEPTSKNQDPPKQDPNTPPNKNADPNNPQNSQPGSPQDMQPGGTGQNGMPKPDTTPKPPQQGMPNPDMTPKPPQQGMPNPDMTPKQPEPKGSETQPPMGNMNNPGMGQNGTGGMDNPNPMQPAPMPQQSPADKQAEEQARQVQNEIDKGKRPEGDAKSNSAAKPEERTDPAQQKPQPKDGANQDAQAKEQPNAADPMNKPMGGMDKSTPSESKSEGKVEKSPDPAQPKPMPNQSDAKGPQQKSGESSERRDEPLGGSPGQDQPEPKQEGTQPKNVDKKQDPASGSTAKPSTDKKEGEPEKGGAPGNTDPNNQQNDPSKKAGQSKPKTEPERGQEKNPASLMGGDSAKGSTEEQKSGDESEAAKAKPEKAAESGTAKSGKQQPMNNGQEASESKPAPSDMNPNDPMKGPSETKSDQPKSPMGGRGEQNPPEKGIEKGMDKPAPGAGKDDPKKGGGELDPKKLEELKQAARDLDSTDPKKREEARNKLDKEFGEQKRKEIEELKDAAKDLKKPDPKKQEEARKKLDNALGEQSRKEIENQQKKDQENLDQLQKDLQSSDKATREAAEKKLDDLVKENQVQKPDPKKLEELKNAAKDLKNPDPKKRDEARNKLENALGEQNLKALEEHQKKEEQKLNQLQKDLQSPDKATREAAQKQLEERMKQAAEQAKGGSDEDQFDPKKLEELKQAARDLNSTDPKKQEEARKKLDKQFGEQRRKEIEEMKDTAKDLKDPDPKKREEARKKLDNALGEQSRKEIENQQKKDQEKLDQLQKDLHSSDKATREAAEKKLDDLVKENQVQKPDPKKLEELKNAAKDLKDPDPKKREEARKKLENAVDEQNVKEFEAFEKKEEEKLNQIEKDLQSPDKEKREAAQNQLEEIVNQAQQQAKRGIVRKKPSSALEDDPRNRAKTAELQLEEFQKNRYNRELQSRLGWTPEKYDDFLKAQQERVKQLQKEAAAFDPQAQKTPKPLGQATLNPNSGGKIETRGDGTGNATGAGAVFSPPGFEAAKRAFAEEALKIQPKKP